MVYSAYLRFITAVQNKDPGFNLTNSDKINWWNIKSKLAEELHHSGIENVPLISKRFADETYVEIQQSGKDVMFFLSNRIALLTIA